MEKNLKERQQFIKKVFDTYNGTINKDRIASIHIESEPYLMCMTDLVVSDVDLQSNDFKSFKMDALLTVLNKLFALNQYEYNDAKGALADSYRFICRNNKKLESQFDMEINKDECLDVLDFMDNYKTHTSSNTNKFISTILSKLEKTIHQNFDKDFKKDSFNKIQYKVSIIDIKNDGKFITSETLTVKDKKYISFDKVPKIIEILNTLLEEERIIRYTYNPYNNLTDNSMTILINLAI